MASSGASKFRSGAVALVTVGNVVDRVNGRKVSIGIMGVCEATLGTILCERRLMVVIMVKVHGDMSFVSLATRT